MLTVMVMAFDVAEVAVVTMVATRGEGLAAPFIQPAANAGVQVPVPFRA